MRLFITLFALVLFGCNETPTKEKTVFVNDTTRVQDTVIFIKDSTMAQTFADSLPNGAYDGFVPPDNNNVHVTILFNPDKKFKYEVLAIGSRLLKTEGTWQRKGGIIWLDVNNRTIEKFRLGKDSLFNVEHNGYFKSESPFVLAKRSLAADRPTWKKQRAEGIDFVGSGTEPFWHLEIDNEKMVLFQLADWKKPVIVPIEKPVANKDSTVYTLTTDNALWTITILSQFCSDGMSDELYEQKVIIRFEGQVYKGCGVLLKR